MTAQPSSQAEREDVALESLTPQIVAYFSADPCLIWSDEWRQFWRPNGNGYTSDQGEAWHLTFAEAYARTRHCDPSKGIRFVRPDREHATPRSMPEEVVEAVARAITEADRSFGYSFNLTRLVDGEETHTLFMDGFEPVEFDDRDDGYSLIAERRNKARADAVLAAIRALGTPSQEASNVG